MATRALADLFINVKPDLGSFDRDVRQGTSRLRPVEITVNPKIASNFEREAQRQLRNNSIEIAVKAKLDRDSQRNLQRELDRGKYEINVKAKLDSSALSSLNRAFRERTITVRVRQVGSGGGGGSDGPGLAGDLAGSAARVGTNGAAAGSSGASGVFQTLPPELKAAATLALVAAAAAAAPVMAAVIGSGIVGGAGLGLIGAGIAAQLQDPKVKLAATQLVGGIKDELVTVTEGIRAPLLGVLDDFGSTLAANAAPLTSIFSTLGKYAGEIGSAFSQGFGEILPQLDAAFQKAAPIFNVIAQGVYDVTRQVGDLFSDIGDNSQDFAAGLQLVFDFVTSAISFASGTLVFLVKGIHDVSDLIANTLDLIGDAQNFLDFDSTKDSGKAMHDRADAVRAYTDELYKSVNATDFAADADKKYKEQSDAILKDSLSYSTILGSLDAKKLADANRTATMAELYKVLGDQTKTSEDRLKALGTAIEKVKPNGADHEKLTAAIIAEGNASGDTKDEIEALQQALTGTKSGTPEFDLITQKILEVGLQSTDAKTRVDTLKQALDNLIAPARGVVDSLESVKQGTIGFSKETEKSGHSLSINSANGLKNRDAIEDQVKSLEDYYTALVNSGTPADKARQQTNDQRDAFIKAAQKAGFNKDEVKKLIDQYGYLPDKVNTAVSITGEGSVFKSVQELLAYQITLARGDGNLNAGRAAAQKNADLNKLYGITKADGGYISGPGTGTSDSIRAWLSNGEFVQTAAATDYYGTGFMNAINNRALPKEAIDPFGVYGFSSGGLVPKFAKGGQVLDPGEFVDPYKVNVSETKLPTKADLLARTAGSGSGDGGGGGPVGSGGYANALKFARDQNGKPYIWASAGPRGYDCSGFMSAILNVIRGKNPYHRLFSTADAGGPTLAGMTKNKDAPFKIGVYNHGGKGHTAGTLNGVNVESTGNHVRVGGDADGWNASRFDYHYGFAKGGLVNSGNGFTRTALNKRKVADLRKLARTRGINLSGVSKKTDIITRMLTYKKPAKNSKAYYNELTTTQLRALAKARGIKLKAGLSKAQIVDILYKNVGAPSSSLSSQVGNINKQLGLDDKKKAALSASQAAAVNDLLKDGKISASNLKVLQGIDSSSLANYAQTLTPAMANRLYGKLTPGQKTDFSQSYAERERQYQLVQKNLPVFKKYTDATTKAYQTKATAEYNRLVKAGVAPDEAARAASDILAQGTDLISKKQTDLGLSDAKYNPSSPGVRSETVTISPASIGAVVGGILARPAEVYVDRTKLAQTQDRDFSRYINSGVA